MAAVQGRDPRRVRRVALLHADRRPDRTSPIAAVAARLRVRGDPAPGRADREAAPRDPCGDRGRAGAVRARRGAHGVFARGRATGRMAARAVRDGPAVAAVDAPRPRRGRLGGGAGVVGGDRHRGVRGHDLDPVQHQRERADLGPGPRHERGAARRGVAEHRLGRARWDPRISRPQPDRAGGADERRRADRGARGRGRSARRGRVRRLGRGADPTADRRRGVGVPRPVLHGRVGVGQAAGRCPRSNTSSSW